MNESLKNQWLEIDKEGLRKSLGQKDKVFLLTEMVSNAWDEDITQVEVGLTRPDKGGFSWLRVTDNSPTGWADLSHSHTMFAESVKKGKSEKRGRFNAGEKDVLALAIEAKLTTVKGQVLFNEDGTRTEGTETRKVGSEFVAKFQLTLEEYEHICNQAKLLIPPKGITTLFNGNPIQHRKSCGSFTESLQTPLADKEGVLRNTERKATVHLYARHPGETAMIYEMGIPIVELGDDTWHVNVMQKVPLSRDRDNVNPSYLRKIRVGVLNAMHEKLESAADAAAAWVRDAVSSPKSSDAAVKHVMNTRFGKDHVSRDVNDKGSKNEAVSKGFNVLEGGALSGSEWARYKDIRDENGEQVLKTSAEVAPTDVVGLLESSMFVPPDQWTPAMKGYAALVAVISLKLIDRPVAVGYINDEDVHIEGCFDRGFRGNKSKKGFTRDWGVMTVNLAYVNPESNFERYSLLLHELAHDKVECNDHLHHEFYDTVNDLGAKLAVLIQDEPQLFEVGTPSCEFTDFQPLWETAAPRETCCEEVAAHAAKATTAR
jgi:hypothetical protein